MPDTSDLIYLNGNILPFSEATLNIEDRGFQFADGVYEVIRICNGVPFALNDHLLRLARSAEGIQMLLGIGFDALATQIKHLIERNQTREGYLYLQLTRGVCPRQHVFPESPQPTLLFYTRPLPPPDPPGAVSQKLLTVMDERWQRCWIKSIALLPNVLAKNTAIQNGADEAAFVQHGIISECSASNLFIVRHGTLLTCPVGPKVLPGITRMLLLKMAAEMNIPTEERPIELAEAQTADEVFITSTTREIHWISEWDQRPTSGGRCGAVTLRLAKALWGMIEKECGR